MFQSDVEADDDDVDGYVIVAFLHPRMKHHHHTKYHHVEHHHPQRDRLPPHLVANAVY